MLNFANLMSIIQPPLRVKVRALEKANKRIVSAKFGVFFNKTCMDEGLLPKFTLDRSDPVTRHEAYTVRHRQRKVLENLEAHKEKLHEVTREAEELESELASELPAQTWSDVKTKLDQLQANNEANTSSRVVSKLNNLYRGNLKFPNATKFYLNLSSHTLTENQQQLLNLGSKCHFKRKVDPIRKKVECEILYDSLLKLQEKNIINISDDLQTQLLSESTKVRDPTSSRLLSPELKSAAKDLRENPNIIVRQADKSEMYVVLDRNDYLDKLQTILDDDRKFQPITSNPTAKLKTDLNKMIKKINSATSPNTTAECKVFRPVTGDFKPGYIYGKVKTHKNGYPLRPIISQIPTPTYQTAKTLNKLLTPFLPAKFQIGSTDEFLAILRTTDMQGTLASLDVESLFTNVPVEATVDIICNSCYNHPTLSPPPLEREDLKSLLLLCTTSCPFTNIDGSMYIQKDGVSMGSPLGVLFANFYMSHVENKVFEKNPNLKPNIFCRYVDDCFLLLNNPETLDQIIAAFKEESVLNFTSEIGLNSRLNFLDVTVTNAGGTLHTATFTKPTNPGIYLNPKGECPDRYKEGTVKALIHRSYRISSDLTTFHASVEKLKQSFINNGYSNRMFDTILQNFINRTHQQDRENPPHTDPDHTHKIYYKNYFSSSYKIDERIMKSIIYNNTSCVNEEDELKLIIYYKSSNVKSTFSRNSETPKLTKLQRSHLIYEYI